MFVAGVVIDEDEDGFSFTGAAANFDAFGNAGEDGVDGRVDEQVRGQQVERRGIEPGADVSDPAFPTFRVMAAGFLEPAVALAVGSSTSVSFSIRAQHSAQSLLCRAGLSFDTATRIERVLLLNSPTQEGASGPGCR